MPRSSSLRQIFAAIAMLLCASLLSADNKPWKGKPYREWDAKDVELIMTESPWVEIVTIQRTWLPVAEKDVPPEQQISGGVRSAPSASGGTTGGNPAATTRESEASEQQLRLYVYWDSSHVMRAASARNAVLHGAMNDADAEQYVNAPQDEYQVVLRMDDMTPFIKNDEKFYEDKVYIEMKRSKLKLPPSHIKYDRDDNGRLKSVIFFFPKKTSSGEPTIVPSETDVTFNCKLPGSPVRVGFKIQKMVGASGLDL
jgi:hypothetical protein